MKRFCVKSCCSIVGLLVANGVTVEAMLFVKEAENVDSVQTLKQPFFKNGTPGYPACHSSECGVANES